MAGWGEHAPSRAQAVTALFTMHQITSSSMLLLMLTDAALKDHAQSELVSNELTILHKGTSGEILALFLGHTCKPPSRKATAVEHASSSPLHSTAIRWHCPHRLL